jgi:hypothetical protein
MFDSRDSLEVFQGFADLRRIDVDRYRWAWPVAKTGAPSLSGCLWAKALRGAQGTGRATVSVALRRPVSGREVVMSIDGLLPADTLNHACIGFTRIGRYKADGDAYYGMHECFYDELGRVVLWGWSSLHGETPDALIADLEQMLADAKRSRDDIFDVPSGCRVSSAASKR